MTTCPILVIGHVDHGKTSLVEALTGIATDRLSEEKTRGLSIVPGFAYGSFDRVMIDFIDAPGHADYIRAMISGASGARVALLVVSAVDGVQAQTLEHIQIAHLLGIHHGVVAITKSDLLGTHDFAAKALELRAALAGTPFGESAFVFCSSRTRFGLDDLPKALSAIASASVDAQAPLAAFFPIDRVFVLEGHGTIVTGTLLGAALKVEDVLEHSAVRNPVSIRRIQVHGNDTFIAHPGERAALNLRGVKAEDVKPGQVLYAPSAFIPSQSIDCTIALLAGAGRALRHMDKVRAHFGTTHAVATARLFADRQIDAGNTGLAQLRFDAPVCLFVGQRIILRSLSPPETLGGATVIDPAAPVLNAGKALRIETLQAAMREDLPAIAMALANEGHGVADLLTICRLARRSASDVRTALAREFVELGSQSLSPSSTLQTLREDYVSRLKAFHESFPLKLRAFRAAIVDRKVPTALSAHVEAQLAAEGRIILTPTEAALPEHNPTDFLTTPQKARMQIIVRSLQKSGLTAPTSDDWTLEESDRDLLALLIHSGAVVQLTNVSLRQTLWLTADAVASAARALTAEFPTHTAFTTGEARASLNTSRKYIVPLLEYFDETGLTVRQGDMRRIK